MTIKVTNRFYKTLAFLLAVLCGLAAGLCALGALYFADVGYYDNPNVVRTASLSFRGYRDCDRLANQAWALYEDKIAGVDDSYSRSYYENALDRANTNFRYAIYDPEGNWVAGTGPIMDKKKAFDSGCLFEQTRVIGVHSDAWSEENQFDYYTLIGMLDPAMPVDDALARDAAQFRTLVKARYAILWIGGAALVLFAGLTIFLCCGAGRYAEGAEPEIRNLDRAPSDLYAAVVLGLEILLVLGCAYGVERMDGLFGTGVLWALLGATMVALFLVALQSLAARIKCRTLLKNTVIWRVLKLLGRAFRWFFRGVYTAFTNLPVLWKTVVAYCAFGLLNVACLLSRGPAILLAALIDLVVLVLLCRRAVQLKQIRDMAAAMAVGDMLRPIEVTGMRGDALRLATDLNSAQEGMRRAISQQVKSERMKTDLITNVSHDLKTPLTGIVSYVDLLKKVALPESSIPFVDALDRQSQRLKKLTTDLVEASKASSGALMVNLAPVDLVELMNQSLGEYGEKLAAAELTPVAGLPETPVIVEGDGRLLWRVIDNLFSNAVKYAMPGTRLYVDVKAEDGEAAATLKNTSKEPLNISPEELMERFVRGDASRATEGSGLGLSIAKDLMKLQNGTLNLSIDGDLFTAEVRLKRA